MTDPTLFDDPAPTASDRPEQRFRPVSGSTTWIATATPGELLGLIGPTFNLAQLRAIVTRLENAESMVAALERSRQTTRPTDPTTSADAAERVRKREGALTSFRAGSQKHRLLSTYAGWMAPGVGFGTRHAIALTDHEAANRVALDGPGVCYWKRCSELRQAGFIETTGETRKDHDSGADRDLCRITPAGVAYAERLGFPRL